MPWLASGLIVADSSGGLGLGEPWDSLFKAGGATLLLILLALWTGRLYLPNTVKEKEARITQLEEEKAAQLIECKAREDRALQERDAALAESKEAALWLRSEAVPLMTRNIDLIKLVTEQMEHPTTTRTRRT